ncbi:hypothetical protein APR11_000450 [Nocardia amikacinitolerans]|nr:hypothetical protein [Nocardia amikacinitolerans]
MRIACSAIQVWSLPVGLPNSSRAAVVVEDNGFHAATAPSHAGMVAMATNGLARNPIGNSSVRTAVTASGLP